MKNVACIIARTESKRLPQKAIIDINGLRMIEYIIQKVKKSKLIDEIYVCTSTEESDKVLLDIAKKNGVKSYAGSLNSVIDRMLDVAEIEKADNLIRITGDNIFTDEVYIDLMLNYHLENKVDYTRTEYLPIGLTAEIIKYKALKDCYTLMDPNYSEYLYLYIFQPSIFKCQVLIPNQKHQNPNWLLTVDTPQDLERIQAIVRNSKDLLNYNEIIEACNNNEIPNLEIHFKDNIKLPGGVFLTYDAFVKEKENRIQQAMRVEISIDEYNIQLRKQNENRE